MSACGYALHSVCPTLPFPSVNREKEGSLYLFEHQCRWVVKGLSTNIYRMTHPFTPGDGRYDLVACEFVAHPRAHRVMFAIGVQSYICVYKEKDVHDRHGQVDWIGRLDRIEKNIEARIIPAQRVSLEAWRISRSNALLADPA